VEYTPQKSVLRVHAVAEELSLRLVHPGTRELYKVAMQKVREPGIWEATVQGDMRGWSYSYELMREGQCLTGILDPNATLVRDHAAYIEAEDSAVAPRPELNPKDAIIYELHVRDFTRSRSSGVNSNWAGRYLGLTQPGTRVPGTDVRTALDHIVDLGVNVVQLMPVHSFSLPYNPVYEWGYMPNDFNAPHPGYASSVELEAPIRELKQMVSALHEAGLRVTLDVVYNHTAESWMRNGSERSSPVKLRNMMALAPDSYYRRMPDGTPANGSGCGNEIASETEIGRHFIRESCKYWVERFGVDGFRFDLMGLIDEETMRLVAEDLHAIDPTIMVYGEPWAAGATPIEVNSKGKQRARGWGVFNDDLRDGLRGQVFDLNDPGFLTSGGDSNIEAMRAGIRGSVETFAAQPTEAINYIECHDNHTLIDRLRETAAKLQIPTTEETLFSMSALGVVTLMTAQGIPFVHCGQDFGRSKGGHDNTYNLGDQVNNIDWTVKRDNHRLYRHYREAIALRTAHPMFRLGDAELVKEAVKFLDTDLGIGLPSGVLAYEVTDPPLKPGESREPDSWRRCVVVLNGSPIPSEVSLPKGNWRAAMVDGAFGRTPAHRKPSKVSSMVRVPAHGASIVYEEREA
jgi:pullulanase